MKDSNSFKLLFAVLIFTIVSLCSFINVRADENELILNKISVGSKSNSVGISKLKVTDGEVDNNMFFNKVGDFIKYDVIINNNSNKDYTIRSITDDGNNQYITYDYSNYKDKVVPAGGSVILNIKATYSNQSPTKVLSNTPVNFNVLYDDGSSILGILNPNTIDHIVIYLVLFIIFVLIFIALFVFGKKYVKSYLVLLLAIGIFVPFTTYADSHSLTFKMKNDIKEETVSYLKKGSEVNLSLISTDLGYKVKRVVNPFIDDLGYPSVIVRDTYQYDELQDLEDEYGYHPERGNILPSIYTYMLEEIKMASSEEFNLVKDSLSEDSIISLDNSDYPTYIWQAEGPLNEFGDPIRFLYYYTEADSILLNKDSSGMFMDIYYPHIIETEKFNTANVENMAHFFDGCGNISNPNVNDFYTGNVTNMDEMFGGCYSFRNIDLSNFDTSKVTNMSNMFITCEFLEHINVSNFDTSNVTDMSYMFCNCMSLIDLDLSSFNTLKVTNMREMFRSCYDLVSLDISSFDFSNVVDMYQMFGDTGVEDDYDCDTYNWCVDPLEDNDEEDG